MRLLVDGDSCPADRRSIIATAARRLRACRKSDATAARRLRARRRKSDDTATALFFVQKDVALTVADLQMVRSADADSEIARRAADGDLIITRDLLLARQLLRAHRVTIIDYCGRPLTADTIAPRLSYREALLSGALTSARGATGDLRKCKKQFADALDRIIRAHAREGT